MNRKAFLTLMITLFFMAACQGEVSPINETPPKEIINIQVTPASAHWMGKVAQCSGEIGNIGITRQILPVTELDLASTDLILRLGARQESDPFVTVLGTEEIVLVVGEDVPITSFSLESVQAIFDGDFSLWAQVPETQDTTLNDGQPIKTLSYPEGHEMRTLFENSFLSSEPIGSNPIVFYSEEALENLLKANPAAIGYALKSQVSEDIPIPSISSDNPQPGLQYVLAITAQEPTSQLRALLLCLQNLH